MERTHKTNTLILKKGESLFEYSKIEWMFLLFLLFCCLQNLSIVTFGGSSTFSLKFSHLFSLCFLPLLIKKRKISIYICPLVVFVLYLLLMSIVAAFSYGLDSLFLNYLFCLYILVLIFSLGANIRQEKWRNMLQLVATVMMLLVYVKLFFNIDIIFAFLQNPGTHPNIDTYWGGGVNIESSWLALFGFVFYNDKKGWFYLTLSFLIAGVYASRAGILINVLLLAYFIVQYGHVFSKKQFQKAAMLGGVGVLIAVCLFQTGVFDRVIERFLLFTATNGVEAALNGRARIWEYVWQTFLENPWGYGLGNGMLAIEMISQAAYNVENLHNLYLQMLIDGGFIGFIVYSIFTFYLLVIAKKELKQNPFLAFIVAYWVASFVQFRGGSSIMFYVLGVYAVSRRQFCSNKTEIIEDI